MSIPNPPPKFVSARIAAANILHGFYGRRWDATIAENHRRIIADLGGARLYCNQQTHSARVRVLHAATDAAQFAGDGLVTQTRGCILGVLSADCAPVLFADPVAAVIGAAHAGWRGALAGITDAVIAQMVALGARRERIITAIGPAIQRNSYAVGAEFRRKFQRESPIDCADCFHRSRGAYHFDLPRYVAQRLAAAEVAAVDVLAYDTFTDSADFFSHRRANAQACGRQISAILLQ